MQTALEWSELINSVTFPRRSPLITDKAAGFEPRPLGKRGRLSQKEWAG